MENKVKFHALERLDLVDVNALQDNMYTYMAKAFGNLIGNANGLLQLPDTITIDTSNELIVFGDFIYIEAQDDIDYADSFENRMIAHDASLANGLCSYDSALQDVQTYYDNNNTLPVFSSNPSLFPLIWVRKRDLDSSLDNRRFWDTSNNVETTNNVNTRIKYAVDFLLSATTPAGGYTKIGRIIDWDVTGNTVELPTNSDQSIELYTFADSIYFSNGSYYLENSSEYNGMANQMGGGLELALKTIRKQIVDIRGNGSADAGIPSTPTSPFNGLPYLSLDALYQRGSNLEDRLNNNKKGSVIFTLISDPANDSHTIETDFYTNTNEGSILSSGISAYYDYGFLFDSLTPVAISSWTTDNHWSLANSVIAIDFGQTYQDYGIRMSVDVVNALALKDLSPNARLRSLHAQPFSDSIASGTDYNDLFKVTVNTYENLSQTATTFYGVKVALTGLFDYFLDVYGETVTSNTVVRIPVKIDFELIKP